MNGNSVGCDAACLLPLAIALAPGESFDLAWDGRYAATTTLPSWCTRPGMQPDAACIQTKHVQVDEYAFWADAGSLVDCSQTTGGPCNACLPRAEGGCTTTAALIGGQGVTAKTRVKLDGGYGIGRSGDPGDWSPLPIELVFQD
jgi:hypothetical protein